MGGRDHSCEGCGRGGLNDPDGRCVCPTDFWDHERDGHVEPWENEHAATIVHDLIRDRRHMKQMQEVGDALAAAVEQRWSGPGGCDCRVCSAAKAWREVRNAKSPFDMPKLEERPNG